MQQELTENLTSEIPYHIIIPTLVIISFVFYSRNHRRRSIRDNLFYTKVPRNKVIIALQIDNLLIQHKMRKQNGFTEMRLAQNYNNKGLWARLKKFLGFGYYLKILYHPTEIKSFITAMKSIRNTQLYLYTTLNQHFAEAILERLDISKLFPGTHRKFCEELSEDGKKHPSEVDPNTRRVIIITSNNQDHNEQDSKYFLVINDSHKRWSNILKGSLKLVKDLIQNIQTVDDLHQRLAEIKLELQSQSDY